MSASALDTLELSLATVRRDTLSRTPVSQTLSEADLRRYGSLADALKSVPGFRVRQQAGMGGYAETRFRGSDGREITVYLDGIPLNSPEDPAVDLGKIPVLSIREMTVDKSGLAEEDGDGVESGLAAIRLSTRLQGNSQTSVTGRLSSFGGREGALAGKAGRGNQGFYWSVGAQAGRNDYPFPSDNGTVFNASDDARARLRNNGYGGGYANLAWRNEIHDGSLYAAGLQVKGYRKRFPGIYGSDSKAFTDHADVSFNFRWKHALSSEPGAALGRASAGGDARFSEDAYADPGQTLGYRSFDQRRRMLNGSAGAGVGGSLPGRAVYDANARAGYENMHAGEAQGFRPYDLPEAHRAFAEPSLRLRWPVSSRWEWRAEESARFDRLESQRIRSLPGANSYQPFRRDAVAATHRLALNWNAGRRGGILAGVVATEKLPSFYELLGDNNGIQSNPDLRVQAAYGVSLQGAWAVGPARVSGGPFYQVYKHPIRLAPLGPSNFLYFQNGASYQSPGWETRFDASGSRWRAGNALTWASPSILRGSAGLSGNVPQYSSRVENFADAALALLPDLWFDVNWEYRSPYFTNDLNFPDTRRPAETLAGAGLSYRKRRLEASLRGENLFDEYYRDFAYSPKSGRRFSLEISLNP